MFIEGPSLTEKEASPILKIFDSPPRHEILMATILPILHVTGTGQSSIEHLYFKNISVAIQFNGKQYC